MVKEIIGDDANTEEDELEHLVDLKSLSSATNTFFELFPCLEGMQVKQLPRLTHLYKKISGLVQNLQKLRILRVYGCGNLEIVFTLSMAKTLVKLEELTMEDCDTRFKKSTKSGMTWLSRN